MKKKKRSSKKRGEKTRRAPSSGPLNGPKAVPEPVIKGRITRTGKSPNALEAAAEARRHQALELRVRGATVKQVGEALGISREAAGKHIRNALAILREETVQNVAELRQVGHERLETMTRKTWQEAMPVDAEGKPKAVNLEAMRLLLRIQEKHAKLMGWAAPEKHQVDFGHLNSQLSIVVELLCRSLPDEHIPKVHEALAEALEDVQSRDRSLHASTDPRDQIIEVAS